MRLTCKNCGTITSDMSRAFVENLARDGGIKCTCGTPMWREVTCMEERLLEDISYLRERVEQIEDGLL